VRALAVNVAGAEHVTLALALLPLVFHASTGTVAPIVAVLRALLLGSPVAFVRASQDQLAAQLVAHLGIPALKPAADRALSLVIIFPNVYKQSCQL
jgi:hypothetical protein